MIKDYILNDDDNVVDVDFGAQRVMLGSGPNEKGEKIVTQKVIMVTFDNVKNKKTSGELWVSARKIGRTLEGLFGINFRDYGSEWALKFYQIKKEEL